MSQLPANSASTVGDEGSTPLLSFPPQPKVMMVDDEKLNSFVVAEYLKAAGFRDLVYTTDPFETLPLARRVHPDVILLDLQMPKLNGFEVLRQLRADDAFADTAVVILTASTEDEEKQRALALGATGFLYKPIDRDRLLAGLRSILASQACQAQRRELSAERKGRATA
ncbi:MAG TPA: response regulator [Pirellulales bacterium]|jgi:CheY-like chemotaxis protein